MLSADHLRTFLAVADAGSYTAAAIQLGFTQPAVSQQIRALEAQLSETSLFRRVGQRMQLTSAGEELLVHAREIVALAERAERHILGLQGQVTGIIRLACAPSTGERVLPALLAAFRATHRAVQFAVEIRPSDDVLNRLTEGDADCVMVDEYPRRRSLDVLPLGYEPVVCVAARGHMLLGGDGATIPDLRATPLIVPQRGSFLRRAIEDIFRRRIGPAVDLDIALETDSATLAVQAAADGLGIAFVPSHRVPRSREIGIVSIGGWELEHQWFLARQRASGIASSLDTFWEFVASGDARKLVHRLGLSAPHAYGNREPSDAMDDMK